MPVMDEFKEEREKLKEQSFQKKLSYFWTYYKWHVIGGAIAVFAIFMTVKGILTKTEDVLYGVILNGSSRSFEEDILADAFEEYLQLDTKEYSVSFNSTLHMADTLDPFGMEAQQFIMVYSAGNDLDIATMDFPRFQKYAYESFYVDLTTCLSSEMLDKLSDKLYYVDLAVLQKINNLQDNNQSVEGAELPDPKKPEEMEQPVPVGIDVSGCSRFTDAYRYEEGPVYLGVIITSERKDMAVKFIEYLFEE